MTTENTATATSLDITEIMRILPHRYPFLLIDRVVELERMQRIVAIKNVTINEPFFQGHFPDYPIMPGRADGGSDGAGGRRAAADRGAGPRRAS